MIDDGWRLGDDDDEEEERGRVRIQEGKLLFMGRARRGLSLMRDPLTREASRAREGKETKREGTYGAGDLPCEREQLTMRPPATEWGNDHEGINQRQDKLAPVATVETLRGHKGGVTKPLASTPDAAVGCSRYIGTAGNKGDAEAPA